MVFGSEPVKAQAMAVEKERVLEAALARGKEVSWEWVSVLGSGRSSAAAWAREWEGASVKYSAEALAAERVPGSEPA